VIEFEEESQKNEIIITLNANNLNERESVGSPVTKKEKSQEIEELSNSLIKNSPNRALTIKGNIFQGSSSPNKAEAKSNDQDSSSNKSPEGRDDPKSHNVSSSDIEVKGTGGFLFDKMIGNQILEDKYKEKLRHYRQKKEEEERLVQDQLEQ